MRGKTLIAAAALALSGAADASKKPGSISIDAKSNAGALLLRVPHQPFDYKLMLQKAGAGGFLSRVFFVDVRGDQMATGDKYQVRTLGPGQYVLKSVIQQNAWSGCLQDKTITFAVLPGTINYLGLVDARPALASIQRTALARGNMTGGGGQGGGNYHDDMTLPAVAARDAADVDAARAFADREMPRSRAPVVLADMQDHSFRSPDDGNRAKGTCN